MSITKGSLVVPTLIERVLVIRSIINQAVGGFYREILSISGTKGLEVDAGGGTLVNGRTSTATVEDWEGNILDCKVGEIRYDKGRRVENLLTASNDFSDAVWIMESSGTKDGLVEDGFQITFDSNSSTRMYGSVVGVTSSTVSIEARTLTGTTTIRVRAGSVDSPDFEVDEVWRKLSLTADHLVEANVRGVKNNSTGTTGTILIRNAQAENVTNQSNRNPSSYIDSETTYNAGIPSVKYFDTENGNTVDGSGVVTEAVGAALPNMKMLHEGGGTNLLARSEDFSNNAWRNTDTPPCVVTVDNAPAPNGSTTADKIVPGVLDADTTTATDGGNRIWWDITGANSDYTNSIFIKSVSGVSEAFSLHVVNRGSDVIVASINTTADATWKRIHVTGLTNGAFAGFRYVLKMAQPTWVWGAQAQLSNYLDSYIKTEAAAVTRAADSINLPLVLGSNFNQDKGILKFQWEVGHGSEASNKGLIGVDNSIFSTIYLGHSNAIVSYDGTSNNTSYASYSAGDIITASVIWNAAENLFSINYSLDSGVTWSTWSDAAYDGAFTAGALINLFYSNPYINKLESAKLFKPTSSDDMVSMKEYVEAL